MHNDVKSTQRISRFPSMCNYLLEVSICKAGREIFTLLIVLQFMQCFLIKPHHMESKGVRCVKMRGSTVAK